jgi:hypothetical protein
VEKPFITCKAGSTKNKKDARQYINHDLAEQLQEYVSTKLRSAAVFSMPASEDVADMLRADLTHARKDWIGAAKHDPKEQARRMESDFLCKANHEGETLDFHSLRHTCGAWLAKAGAHPQSIQAIMRHSSITLTMGTYGHLFPGQEAETVSRLPNMMHAASDALEATGTDGNGRNYPQQYSQQSADETVQDDATGCDEDGSAAASDQLRNILQIAELCDVVRDDATGREIAPKGTLLEPLGKMSRARLGARHAVWS